MHSISIEISANSTAIRFLEHVIVNMSLAVSLSYTDKHYDYSSIPTEYLEKDAEFVDFEADILDDYSIDSAPSVLTKRDSADSFFTADHARRGDIMVELTSPNGTKSVLLPYRKYDFINVNEYFNWPFMSLHHWGESPIGTWTIVITYKNTHASVNFELHNFKLYGTSEVPEAVSRIPQSCDPACDRGCAAYGEEYCDSCKEFRDTDSLECISDCPQNLTKYNHYCGDIVFADGSDHSDILLPVVVSASVVVFVAFLLIITIALTCLLFKYRKRLHRRGRYNLVSVEEFD